MTDMVLRGLPDELVAGIRRRAEANGTTTEAEAEAMLRHAVFQDHLREVLETKGLGSALAAIGREYGAELDIVRDQTPAGSTVNFD